jgi:hypothetical protein
LNGTGTNNTAIGFRADVESGDLNNATAIGARAFVSQSNSLVLGSMSGVNGCTADNVCADTNVGIGTTAPHAKLHISGTGTLRVRIDSDTNAGLGLALGGQSKWSVATVTGGNLVIFNDATNQNAITIDGTTSNVGISTLANNLSAVCTNGSHQLVACSSSLRYKTNIRPFIGGLDIINRLRPISFIWKQGGNRDVGFGAEEVAKVEPLFTFRNDKGQIEGVKYDRLSVVLVNAVQQQQRTIETLERQNAAVRNENAQLEARLERLEQKLDTRQSMTRRSGRRKFFRSTQLINARTSRPRPISR